MLRRAKGRPASWVDVKERPGRMLARDTHEKGKYPDFFLVLFPQAVLVQARMYGAHLKAKKAMNADDWLLPTDFAVLSIG